VATPSTPGNPRLETPDTRIGRGGQAVGVDVPHPIEERDDVGDLVRAETERGHQPAVALLGVEFRGVGEKLRQVGRPALRDDLRQIRSIVGSLAEERVTVLAIVLAPYVLAATDGLGETLLVRARRDRGVRVHGEQDEEDYEEDRSGEEEAARRGLGHRPPPLLARDRRTARTVSRAAIAKAATPADDATAIIPSAALAAPQRPSTGAPSASAAATSTRQTIASSLRSLIALHPDAG
jgi:hypothetical protein